MRREKARPELAELAMLEAYHQFGLDPWFFVSDCCWTKDEADSGKVKRLPDKPYLRYVARVWQEEDLLAIPKSRRMLMTWLMLCLHLWAALLRPNSAIFVQSKKQEDSEFLLGDNRLMFVYSRLPPEYPWARIEKAVAGRSGKGYSFLRFSNGSYITAVGQGPDQLRQYTASYVYLTEMAFWEWAEETFASLKPTIQGGGKITIDSSAGPGFFERLVHGEI
ncbi:MAG: hypothetical protein P4N59_17725 [Negativicutes bacterium]|nr:hypothetical protein [Negativicutes bacterium]